jgi:ribonuclease HI
MNNLYRIVADGGKKSTITYGSFKLFSPDDELLEHNQFVIGYGTSNMAEYIAVERALGYVVNYYTIARNILVQTDSRLVFKQLTGQWRCEKPHLRRILRRVQKLEANLDNIRYEKIKGTEVKKILGH